MFGPLPLITMRQQAYQPGHAQPLALARGDELVEDHLRAIRKIAELRLPHRERVGFGERIPILEADHRLLGEHRVDDLEPGLPLPQIVEWNVSVFVLLIDQHRVAL